MGACEFQSVSFGRDAKDAFAAAINDARGESGADGYSGTIAEKSDFTEVTLPKGVTAMKAHHWAQSMVEASEARGDLADGSDIEPAERKRMERAAAKAERRVPKAHHSLAIKIARLLVGDKYGPALCLKITGKTSRDLRVRYGKSGRRGDFYLFAGLAPE